MTKKYIVFDLDETLGNFVQLGIFCDAIENMFQVHLTQQAFNEICDTFTHFFRPNLLNMLEVIQYEENIILISNSLSCPKLPIISQTQLLQFILSPLFYKEVE